MEIDFRTPREALIYEIGLKTGIIQREAELRNTVQKTLSRFSAATSRRRLLYKQPAKEHRLHH